MKVLRAVVALGLVLAPLAATAPASASDATSSAVTITKALTRAHLNADGTESVVDRRTVTITLSQTRDLHSRQPIRVSWKGAHPTGSVIGDPTSSLARVQEYPMVLMECRGTDNPDLPVAQQLRPETCWTQSSPERFSADFNTGFPAWRVDRRATQADRHALVNAPSPRPAGCGRANLAEHWLPFVAATGTTFNASNLVSCGTRAPESSDVGGGGQPSNTTYGLTGLDGTGSTKFTTWTQEDNASLGCSTTVPCSLVAVPIMGVSCDESAATQAPADRPNADVLADVRTNCRATGAYAPGAPNQNAGGNDESVSGSLWWTASNWSGRISVPLGFAPLANVCDIAGNKGGVDIYGSELLTQATAQWRPTFCLTKGVTSFKHVQVGEPQAKSLLATGNIEAGFISAPPATGFEDPVVLAPTAVTGFAIGYVVDNAQHEEVNDLRLTPRLLAKLLTESYPATTAVKSEYTALSGNPLDMSKDPEFVALNPQVGDISVSVTPAELYSLSSDSDIVRALTAYITADPDARAWLDGKPDEHGMVVNPNYKGIALPVESWPQREAFQPKRFYDSGNNPCLQNDPVPYLPLVAAPTARVATISLGLQFAISNSQIVCQDAPGAEPGVGAKLVSLGRQRPGSRFLIGLTSLGDAERFQIDEAELRVHDGVFAAPTPAGLAAAASLLTPDATTGTWTLPQEKVIAGTGAPYPGTMLLSTAVRTKGIAPADASAYAAFLRFVAGQGQVAGLGNGQLPPGFLPLTKGNGLGDLAAYTVRAASAVAAQSGTVPALVEVAPTPTASRPLPADNDSPETGQTGDGVTGTAELSPQTPTVPGVNATQSPALVTPALAPSPGAGLAGGITPLASAGAAALVLPILVGAGLVGGLLSWLIGRFGRQGSAT